MYYYPLETACGASSITRLTANISDVVTLTAASLVCMVTNAQSAWMVTRISPARAVLHVLVMAMEA